MKTIIGDEFDAKRVRLSDRILYALELAIEQEDVSIAEALVRCLELAMTRNTGGGEFVERRDYPDDVKTAMDRLRDIKKQVALMRH